MRKSKQLCVFMALIAGSAIAFAADIVPPVKTVGDLAPVLSDTIMTKALVVRAQARADLEKITGSGASPGLGAQQDTSLPQVRRIMQTNGVGEATLGYTNGRIDVREGDRIPGGFTVVRIDPDASSVQLKSKGGKTFDVPVSSDAGLSVTQSTQSAPSTQPNAGSVPPFGAPPPLVPLKDPNPAPPVPPNAALTASPSANSLPLH